MRILICVLMTMLSLVTMDGRDCGYCHGNGRVRAHVGVGSFGVSNRKAFCRQCNIYYDPTSDHWHTCPACKGVKTSGRSKSDSKNGYERDLYLSNLTPDEYANFQYLVQMSMTATEQAPCNNCNATGYCPACNGSGLSPIRGYNDPTFGYMANPCPTCNGIKNCVRCAGLKWINVPSEKLRAQALEQIQYYKKLASERQAKKRR